MVKYGSNISRDPAILSDQVGLPTSVTEQFYSKMFKKSYYHSQF